MKATDNVFFAFLDANWGEIVKFFDKLFEAVVALLANDEANA